MSEAANHDLNTGDQQSPPADKPSEELAAVEPPTAGLIVRLFLVPALIVMAVLSVWLLFGKLATSEQDWRTLVGDVDAGDPDRRWMGVIGLAQLLKADRDRGPDGQQLARNPRIADRLSQLLRRQLDRQTRPSGDDLKRLALLVRTLGLLDVPATTLPVLRTAMLHERDRPEFREVRNSAVAAVAMTAGRSFERQRPLDDSALIDDLVEVSQDGDRMVRQLSAYALGLVAGEKARQRLIVLLDDRDVNTRVNAAIGLARRNSTAGIGIFKSVFAAAAGRWAKNTDRALRVEPATTERKKSEEFQQNLVLKNSLKAVELLAGDLTARQRSDLVELIEPLAEGHPVRYLRVQADHVARTLRSE